MGKLHPVLEMAVERGLMTRAHAEYVDRYTDELADGVSSGELTLDEASDLAGQRAIADGFAILRGRS